VIRASNCTINENNDSVSYKETNKAEKFVSLCIATKEYNESILHHNRSHLYETQTMNIYFFIDYVWGRLIRSMLSFREKIFDEDYLLNKPPFVFGINKRFELAFIKDASGIIADKRVYHFVSLNKENYTI